MRHFIPDPPHELPEVGVEVTPDPELVDCPRCAEYLRVKGIRKSIADRTPIDMEAKIIKSPFDIS